MSDHANHHDMRSGCAGPEWMEPALKQHLHRVEAPAGLWSQIQANPLRLSPKAKPALHNRLAWATAVTVFMIGGAFGGHSYVRRALAGPVTSASTLRHTTAQAPVKFAMQVACQACHNAGEL